MKTFRLLMLISLILGLLSACGGGSESAPVEGDLVIDGMVITPLGFAENELRGYETIDVVSKNKDGEESTYTGVPIITLLGIAEVAESATKVVFIGEDDSKAEVALADLNACVDCIVSFRSKGGFSIVMPGFPKGSEVKGVTKIIVE